ncbi:hypothetical protein [Roseomonas sp. USHLN139]|uniref:hypothetical protein n=1 Tax=Roseomonas sp. USHLN139 TaxID=3081298 RepID=UPI003B026D26
MTAFTRDDHSAQAQSVPLSPETPQQPPSIPEQPANPPPPPAPPPPEAPPRQDPEPRPVPPTANRQQPENSYGKAEPQDPPPETRR